MINTALLKKATPGAAPINLAQAAHPAGRMRVEVVHHVPGRLRLKAASLKRNMRASAAARRQLRRIDGVTMVTVNPCTGGLLVEYDRELIRPDDIVRVLGQHGYAALPSSQLGTHEQNAMDEVVRMVGRSVADAVVERMAAWMLQAII